MAETDREVVVEGVGGGWAVGKGGTLVSSLSSQGVERVREAKYEN